MHSTQQIIDTKPGTYILILLSTNNANINVGKLGVLEICKGFYLYIGSAFGPGGLSARIKHHSRIAKKPHWHIDYLRLFTNLNNVWLTYDSQHREHQWAQLLKDSPGGFVPLKGFGSSDCNCESHLFFYKLKPSLKNFQMLIRKFYPKHDIIQSLQINNS